MADYSTRALRGKGIAEQEKMRMFLGCEQAPPGTDTYDFRKGEVRFEYKHSALFERNRGRSRPTKTWVFHELRGTGRRKEYDYLLLEGDYDLTGRSEVFRIPSNELNRSFPECSCLYVTLTAQGRPPRLQRGSHSEFVWNHRKSKENLRSWCDNLLHSAANEPGSCDLPDSGQLKLDLRG